MFDRVAITTWRQFENIDIKFHRQLTIITGANGAGKTSILNLINQHFGWQTEFVGTPKKDEKTGVMKYLSDFWKNVFGEETKQNTNRNNIGVIQYVGGESCKLFVPDEVGQVYNIEFERIKRTHGFPIPSHRPIYKYQHVANISINPITKRDAHNRYSNIQRTRYQGGHSDKSETYFIKEGLISLATFGYGNKVVTPNSESIKIFEGFEVVLKKVLPPKLGFNKLTIRLPEVVLETDSGEFPIDAVSGGIASIIDLAWQVYMFDDTTTPFVVTIDEPENHLHPEMQKSILPNFIQAFPHVQFIIATHNPFIISSVADSFVYVLNYNERNRVFSIQLENIDKAGTANEILREVLGIDSTMPNWIDVQIDELIQKYSERGVNSDTVKLFKVDLKKLGFDKYLSEAVVSFIEKGKG